MRHWIAVKLIDLAFKIAPDATVQQAKMLVTADDWARQMMSLVQEPKKSGRPKGRKDSVGPKPVPKRKPGRPLGSKNKPKVS